MVHEHGRATEVAERQSVEEQLAALEAKSAEVHSQRLNASVHTLVRAAASDSRCTAF